MRKVLVPYERPEMVATIKSIIGDEASVVCSSRDVTSMLEVGEDAIVVASGRVPAEYIREAKDLKMIQSFGAGINSIDVDAVEERGDIVVCNSHVNSEEVAEYAVMLLLAAAKNIVNSDRALRNGDWKYGWNGERPNIEVRGKTCVLVGFGNVGKEIARRLRVFGLRLLAVTRSGTTDEPGLIDDVFKTEDIEAAVRQADFVILALPLTTASKGLVGTEFLSWMSPTSMLVNISRGAIVEESALYDVLEDGQIYGAALDVWWSYPGTGDRLQTPSEYSFHELDNIIMSPHRAAYSERIKDEQVVFVAENILRFLKGKIPQNIVDLKQEY